VCSGGEDIGINLLPAVACGKITCYLTHIANQAGKKGSKQVSKIPHQIGFLNFTSGFPIEWIVKEVSYNLFLLIKTLKRFIYC
jgi:hypothetical protein